MRMVGTNAGDRGEEDGRNRRTQRQMHELARWKSLGSKQHNQYRDHQRASANSEQAGKKSSKGAESDIRQPPNCHHNPINCLVIKVHSSGLTGRIDKRLPRARRRMLASSGWPRSSTNGTYCTLPTKRTSRNSQGGLSNGDFGSW